MKQWWIDEPHVLGSANPSDDELIQLRADGFAVIICLLDLREQQTAYDRAGAASAGWEWHNVAIPDFAAPTIEQIQHCLSLVHASAPDKKVVVHCRGGIGRTGTIAAAYWMMKGMPCGSAIVHVRERRPYAVENRDQEAILREFEKVR